METETREQRRSALDDFAASAMQSAPVPVAVSAAAMDVPFAVYGSRHCDVHRDELRLLNRLATSAATLGDDAYYRFPVKNRKENRVDFIEGPSIGLANELCRLYGNCEVEVRVRDVGDAWLFNARFIDFENGFSSIRPFAQRKSAGTMGGTDDGRRLEIAFAIGVSKAYRNVVVNALQNYAKFMFEEARQSLVSRIGENLKSYRERTIERVSANIDIRRAERVIGRPAGEWLAPDVAKVIALMKGVSDGMADMNETFPPLNVPGDQAVKAGLDEFASTIESPSATPLANDGDVGEAVPPNTLGASPTGAADDPRLETGTDSAASLALKRDMIDKVLSLAGDKKVDAGSRLESLDLAKPGWLDALADDAAFVRQTFDMAIAVAKGESKVDAARKFLETKGGVS